MKKTITILLVFALAFTIAACGESAATGTGEAETTTEAISDTLLVGYSRLDITPKTSVCLPRGRHWFCNSPLRNV